MAEKKTDPKNLRKHLFLRCLRVGKEKTRPGILRLLEKLGKQWEKHCFGHDRQMAGENRKRVPRFFSCHPPKKPCKTNDFWGVAEETALARKKPPGILRLLENLENPWENNVLGTGGVASKNKSYGLAKTLKIIGKSKVLSTCIKWQERKQIRGRPRPTTKSPGAR